MMTAALSIAAMAVLFAVYGLIRPAAGCGSDCGHCARPCNRQEADDGKP